MHPCATWFQYLFLLVVSYMCCSGYLQEGRIVQNSQMVSEFLCEHIFANILIVCELCCKEIGTLTAKKSLHLTVPKIQTLVIRFWQLFMTEGMPSRFVSEGKENGFLVDSFLIYCAYWRIRPLHYMDIEECSNKNVYVHIETSLWLLCKMFPLPYFTGGGNRLKVAHFGS